MKLFLKTLFQGVCRQESGGIAAMFAWFLVPFLAVSTISIEIGRVIYAETKLSYALDSAVIAAAKYEAEDIQQNAINIFNANFPPGFMGITTTPVITVSEEGKLISGSVESTMPTIIGTLFNVTELRVNASAHVRRILAGLEAVLLLDVSAEGGFGIPRVKNLAKDLVRKLIGQGNTRENTLIAIAPYAMTFNIGKGDDAAAGGYGIWLADPGTLQSFPNNEQWAGCVKSREGDRAISEAPPIGEDKLHVFFAESTKPHHDSSLAWDNDWYKDGGDVVAENPYSHTSGGGTTDANIGPNLNCVGPISLLQEKKGDIISYIESLESQLGGSDSSRIVWGWRLLSPLWAEFWGAPAPKSYTAANNQKAVIMMTSGIATIPDRSLPTGGGATTPTIPVTGYETQIISDTPPMTNFNRVTTGTIYGKTTRAEAIAAINAKTLQVCTAMKDKGVKAYVIMMEVDEALPPEKAAIFEECASSPEHYFPPGTDNEILDHFESIRSDLHRVFLTQ